MQDPTTLASTSQSQTYGARLMEPRFGFEVYKLSVKLFEKHPLQIFLLGLAYLLFVFISAVAPHLVQLAVGFIAPIAAIGVLRCIRLLDSTVAPVRLAQLKDIFFDPTRKEDYVVLGVLNVGYVAISMVFSLSSSALAGWAQFFVGVLYTAAIFFAYPLVEFDRLKPVEAIKASLQISKLNWKAGIVYLFASIVFTILSLCALGVGFFIYFPLALISRYVAYRIILNK